MLALAVAAGAGFIFQESASAQGAVPAYRVNALWPQPFPDEWVLGSVLGVTTDAQNNVWVVHRGHESLEANERGMAQTPPSSSVCCFAAPFVLRFDPAGKITNSWGGPSTTYRWPQAAGGIVVDAKGNVWISGGGLEPAPEGGRGRGGAPPAAAPAGRGGAPAAPPPPPVPDAHVLKFNSDGRHLLTIGTPGKMDGPDSQTTLNRPTGMAYDSAANEIFIADTGNRRIAVFDADTGAYKRHWFAYGEKAAGAAPGPYNPSEPAAKSFRDATCVEIARDGMVYVCDKSSNRIQVFDKSGKFVKEHRIEPETLQNGSVWDLVLSEDRAQRYIFVADGANNQMLVVERDSGKVLSRFSRPGRMAGELKWVHNMAIDSKGNLYTAEVGTGRRAQKFARVQ
jgi:DNA-binding beta-propeller fold protein YncE